MITKIISIRLVLLLMPGFLSYSYSHAGTKIQKTFVLAKDQYPARLIKFGPAQVYLSYNGLMGCYLKLSEKFLKRDTIVNLKGFMDSVTVNCGMMEGYRLIFETGGKIDSVWQVDKNFNITDKAFNLGNDKLKLEVYDAAMKQTDNFIFDYGKKYKEAGDAVPSLGKLLRYYTVYSASDRNKYAAAEVWILSVGIDDYGPTKYETCKSDAQSYADFFKKQFIGAGGSSISDSIFHEYVLLDKDATKEGILASLKDIMRKASSNDYFIFNFSGCSNEIKIDPEVGGTNFFPFDVIVTSQTSSGAVLKNRKSSDTTDPYKNCLPLRLLQEFIQLIPAQNQLFISEAGPSEKFKTEFIRILMQNSPTAAKLLNKNRIIIVPNGFGMDDISCNGQAKAKGPINYFITSLDPSFNIYDIFKDDGVSNMIAYKIKDVQYACKSFPRNYFDIFFERAFLQQYHEIFGDDDGQTRGVKLKSKEVQETLESLTGNHYAMVVGTNHYKAKGWKDLNNPISDARAIGEELAISYGFEVQVLEDQPMDSIYKAIREYYSKARPNDQLVLYFAGHGDADNQLLDDGFIVCADSKPVEEDPMRNTYIPYDKLKKVLNNIPSRQILVLLDVCHGGTFDAKVFNKKGGDTKDGTYNITNKNILQLLKDKLPLRTRKFLSSVGAEPAFDGQAGKHSPFANYLLQILRTKGSGSNGIITLKEIYAVLEKASLNETATLKISPQMNDFGTVDAFTEFLFIPVEKEVAKDIK